MGKAKAWIEAMRLRTLPVSVAGVIAGTACAVLAGGFSFLPFMICLLFAILAQIVSNFANEYYDWRNGLDRKGREGFRRGVTEGDIRPESMLKATYLLLALDAVLGSALIFYGGWWLIAAGLAIAVFAIAYSAGPYPLSHHGLGDLAVILFFGVVPVMLTSYVQIGGWEGWQTSLPVSIGIGLLAADVLVVNNYRDADDDRAVRKHTTAVIFGRRAMHTAYLISALAGIALISYPLAGKVSAGWIAAPLAMTAIYAVLWRNIGRRTGHRLNPMLGMTAVSLFISSVLLIIASATA